MHGVGWSGRLRPTVLAISAAVVATTSGCSHDSAGTGVKPTTAVACQSASGAAVVTLTPTQATSVNCAQGGTVFELASGASYLLVPELATGNVTNTATAYTLGSPNATAVSDLGPLAAEPRVASTIGGGQVRVDMPGARQRWFDSRLREADRRAVRAGPQLFASRVPSPGGASGARVAQPDVGSIRSFRVISSAESSTNPAYKTVDARLSYVGANVLLYVDTLTAANGYASADLSGIGDLFDKTLYPIDVTTFGQPSDIDGNGRLIMLMTPVVNALTKAADCKTTGFIAGFFDGLDLASTSPNSNQGEVFYTIAPDPAGLSSCAHSVADIEFSVPATFLHEVQHLINFSQHVILHGGRQEEEGWLDEGLSIVAEELGSRYYEQRFPPPSGRTNPLQLFPDSAQGFIGSLLEDSYAYLLEPDTATVTLHSDSDDGFAWRGSVWLLARWLGDQKGEDVYKRLEATALTGTANIESATGESFPGLFADFGLSLYTDSLLGVPRADIPARDRFRTRNLRQMYAALFRAAGPSPDVPRAFPIVPRVIPATGAVKATIVPGTVTYYRVDTPATGGPVTIRLATPTGTALPASLRPQIAIFRLPP
jgi:hypothetical protein